MTRSSKRKALVLGGLCIAVAGVWAVTRMPPAKARALDPVARELVEIHRNTGEYPLEISGLPSLRHVTAAHSVYFGKRTATNLAWDAWEVSSHDLTVLVATNLFVMYAPTGKIKPWSFSSYPVWRRTSEDADWRKGRIHWSLLGTYWSEQ